MERKFWFFIQNIKGKRDALPPSVSPSRNRHRNDNAPRAGFLGGACPPRGVVGDFADIGAVVVDGVGGARIVCVSSIGTGV